MVTMSSAASVTQFPSRPHPRRRHSLRFHSVRCRARRFGRRAPFTVPAKSVRTSAISDDLRLFAATFAGGFLFVSVLIA